MHRGPECRSTAAVRAAIRRGAGCRVPRRRGPPACRFPRTVNYHPCMNFDHSPKVRDLQTRLAAFMDDHVYPNEATYRRQIRDGDRWQPVPITEDLKPKARAAGLW